MASSASTWPFNFHFYFSGAIHKHLIVCVVSTSYAEEPTIHSFNTTLESWSSKVACTEGHSPPIVEDGASCTSVNGDFYLYGGHIYGSGCHGSLYKFQDFHWSRLSSASAQNAPQAKAGCQMLHYGSILLIFGGYHRDHDGEIIHPQPGAVYEENGYYDMLNNEVHVFNCIEGTWSSPTVTGTRPPPCSNFTMTMVEGDKAVLFGGLGSDKKRVKHVYILDFISMHWSKLDDDKGEPWPEGRESHAAVCLGFGGDHPHLLITGGWGNGDRFSCDAWTLDIKSWRWREVKGLSIERYDHSTTGFTINKEVTEVVVFGGYCYGNCTETTIFRFECQECPSSDGPPTMEWVLTDKAEGHQLGTEQRIREKGLLLGIPSLEEQSMAVIISSLLQQKMKPDELDARLSDYVPRILRNAIIDKLKLNTLLLQFQ